MAKRQWKHLNQGTTYTLTAGNGWSLSMNENGTVNLAFSGVGGEVSGIDLSADPDPGSGDKNPPTEP